MAYQTKDIKFIKLNDIIEIRGMLKVLGSGLRIGGGDKEAAGIGEIDNRIIRHPITTFPYVPGSSIKGKVRSLLESRHCPPTQRSGKPCDCATCEVCELFGCHDVKKKQSPTRLVFRDCQPSTETIAKWEESGLSSCSEVKYEVIIDRSKGAAAGSGSRTMERIPSGSSFDFAFSLRIFEGDNVKHYYEFLAEGFELLEKHYLGGSGSRGYGQVAVVAEDGTPMAEHLRRLAKEC